MSRENMSRREAALDRIENYAGGEPPRTRAEVDEERQRDYAIRLEREARERAEWVRESQASLEQLRIKRREIVNAIIVLYKQNQLALENFNAEIIKCIKESGQDECYVDIKEFKIVLDIALASASGKVHGHYEVSEPGASNGLFFNLKLIN